MGTVVGERSSIGTRFAKISCPGEQPYIFAELSFKCCVTRVLVSDPGAILLVDQDVAVGVESLAVEIHSPGSVVNARPE